MRFDDDHAVADAGLILAASLAEGLLLRELFDTHVELGDAPGAANAGDKAMTLIHSALAGGEWIEDADRLRAGATGQVLGHRVAAPSTLGVLLRSFTWGSARQLDQVAGQALCRAWAAGGGPGSWPVTIDLDATHCETYGLGKQGASKVGRDGTRGYHPLLATVAGGGDVLHSRLREGVANSGRGAASFVAETINRARRAGASGPITLRADSGFYNHKVVNACYQQGVRCSITVRLDQAVNTVIAQIPDDAWTPIPYWLEGGADVAETPYRPFGRKGRGMRLIVRRVRPTPGSQLALFTAWDYHAFVTDRDGPTLELEADHRRHAQVENVIRDLKHGVGLNHLPSGRFAANAAWLTLNVIAHNLARWVSRLGLGATLITTKTLRVRYLNLPGRLTRPPASWTCTCPAAGPGRASSCSRWTGYAACRSPPDAIATTVLHQPAQGWPQPRRTPRTAPRWPSSARQRPSRRLATCCASVSAQSKTAPPQIPGTETAMVDPGLATGASAWSNKHASRRSLAP